MDNLYKIRKELKKYSNKKRAMASKWFFKTGKGEYGEGDVFIGISVPDLRSLSKRHLGESNKIIDILLKSKIHEERLLALMILVNKYKSGDNNTKRAIYNYYLKNTKNINNWDLVDLSAPYIIGDHLIDKRRDILIKLSKSKCLWDKRISIVSTFAFIKNNEYQWTFKIVKNLMKDNHDLIHKACGWMLREVGKRISKDKLKLFLDNNLEIIPRTTLRYAIEHFNKKERANYLKK